MTSLDDSAQMEHEVRNRMEHKSFLVFRLHCSSFAVQASVAREILWLPEITPVEEAPPHIIGVINLRGKIVPVMDLKLRLGHTPGKYLTTQCVIIMDTGARPLGIIVDEASEVLDIPAGDIEISPFHGMEDAPRPCCVAHTAKVGNDILMVLEPSSLLIASGGTEEEAAEGPSGGDDYFCPEAGPEERAVFHARAVHLMQAKESENLLGLMPMSIVRLGGEFFGVDLSVVREFCNMSHPTPIPCCPPHVVGNMNLRGSILTLVDIRDMLHLSPAARAETTKVIVAAHGELVVGVVIEDLVDVVTLDANDVVPVPSAVRSVSEKYYKGTARYHDIVMTILDMPRVLMSEDLIVNEEP